MEKVVVEAPQFRDAWLARGQAYLCLGQMDRARESFHRAIALDPRSVEGYSGLARVSHKEGNERQSKEDLNRALAAINLRIAESVGTRRNWSQKADKALILALMGRRDEAVEIFEKIIQENPEVRGPAEFLAKLKENPSALWQACEVAKS